MAKLLFSGGQSTVLDLQSMGNAKYLHSGLFEDSLPGVDQDRWRGTILLVAYVLRIFLPLEGASLHHHHFLAGSSVPGDK